MPFHVALGAAGENRGEKLLEDYIATLAWGSYSFGLNEQHTKKSPYQASFL
jgi:hypothetical protein